MARNPTITQSQILEAARAVFLEQGFSATTADVANRAGISSASIFKHFPTKESLFFAAMSDTPRDRIWTAELEAEIGQGDPRSDLLKIALRIASYSEELLPRMMLAWSIRQPGEIVKPPGIEPDFTAIAAYIGREMALGRIVRGDPIIPAMTLLHTVVGFTMSQTLQNTTVSLDTSTFLEEFVNLLWRGLDPNLQTAR
ncbi:MULTISPECIES: TetR/AcrR family transcriptional regulator [Nostocales]|uniref:TetR/AcrR family transcriptional regulator n=3 Tax=Nostocales TaxID=1161 RepID=A0A0C1QSQ1_9CYAN|nr:TetR/AcrR family transcriptional regulator [Tolypothrix bouteillei]KAF3889736.1 TetR/AcrR family transcriptional regulator [Tolypothrix bouteillei VB521301]